MKTPEIKKTIFPFKALMVQAVMVSKTGTNHINFEKLSTHSSDVAFMPSYETVFQYNR